METIRVDILNPKAKKLLQDLMELKLIRFTESEFPKNRFLDLLAEMRKDNAPSLEQIQEEVKAIRKQMNKG